jgi:hypothetical protein
MYPRAGSLLIAAVLGALLAGCSPQERQHGADEQLRAIYTSEWKWRLEQLPEHEIGTEVDRYLAWPGQALAYYLGERAILEARARAETALGERFNVRAFHDAVLELGSVPLPVLERRIDRFIVEGGRGPYPDME